jgi:4-diphosphocytidyl-2-C-methyl-D-erythritol kinase
VPGLTALAPAKVNLLLHVGPVGVDGYHPLASLVAFADVGDRLTARPDEGLSLTVTGPFGAAIADEPDNLVLRAVRSLAERCGVSGDLALTLDKRLPVAAGLGGGSADAGAALRLARTAWGLEVDDALLAEVAGRIGADGPMCLVARPAWAEGRGDELTPEPRLPPLPAVLVNPGAPSLTGPVYRAYDAGPACVADRPDAPEDWRLSGVIDWLAGQRNDLQAPAISREPAIGAALAAVSAAPGVRLARMSGSGATVFGLFETAADAAEAAARLATDHGDWWVRATILGDPLA